MVSEPQRFGVDMWVESLTKLESQCLKSIAIVQAAKRDVQALRASLSKLELIDDGIVVDESNDGGIQIKEFISDRIVTNGDHDERLQTNMTALGIKSVIPAIAYQKQNKGDPLPGVSSASYAFGKRESEALAVSLFPQLQMKLSTTLTNLVDFTKDVSADPYGVGLELEYYINVIATSKFTEGDIYSIHTWMPTSEDGFLEHLKETYYSRKEVSAILEGAVIFQIMERGGLAKYAFDRPEPKPPHSCTPPYNHVWRWKRRSSTRSGFESFIKEVVDTLKLAVDTLAVIH